MYTFSGFYSTLVFTKREILYSIDVQTQAYKIIYVKNIFKLMSMVDFSGYTVKKYNNLFLIICKIMHDTWKFQ